MGYMVLVLELCCFCLLLYRCASLVDLPVRMFVFGLHHFFVSIYEFCDCFVVFFFKQKTAYEMRISDWSSDVCSSDLQVVQAMVAEAGFNVTLKSMEFASLLSEQTAGNYQASQVGWSGRIDPDGNIHQFLTCKGGINDSKYCNPEVDKLLDTARRSNNDEERKASYDAARKILAENLPNIYL